MNDNRAIMWLPDLPGRLLGSPLESFPVVVRCRYARWASGISDPSVPRPLRRIEGLFSKTLYGLIPYVHLWCEMPSGLTREDEISVAMSSRTPACLETGSAAALLSHLCVLFPHDRLLFNLWKQMQEKQFQVECYSFHLWIPVLRGDDLKKALSELNAGTTAYIVRCATRALLMCMVTGDTLGVLKLACLMDSEPILPSSMFRAIMRIGLSGQYGPPNREIVIPEGALSVLKDLKEAGGSAFDRHVHALLLQYMDTCLEDAPTANRVLELLPPLVSRDLSNLMYRIPLRLLHKDNVRLNMRMAWYKARLEELR